MMALGNYLLTEDEDFDCLEANQVIPLNNQGAAFLLAYSLILLSFSFMIWFVLYKLPEQHGLISKLNRSKEKITVKGSIVEDLNISETDQAAVDVFINIAKEEENMVGSLMSPQNMGNTSKEWGTEGKREGSETTLFRTTQNRGASSPSMGKKLNHSNS